MADPDDPNFADVFSTDLFEDVSNGEQTPEPAVIDPSALFADAEGSTVGSHIDSDDLDRYQHLAVEGATPQRSTIPPHLTTAERELYERLVDHFTKHGTGLLLEQERIPWAFAYGELMNALGRGKARHDLCE